MTKPLGAGQRRPDGAVRAVHLSLSLLPMAVVAVVGVGAVVCAETLSPATTRVVFAVSAALGALIAVAAVVAAGAATSWVRERLDVATRLGTGTPAVGVGAELDALRAVIVRGEKDLARMVDQVKAGERPVLSGDDVSPPDGNDLYAFCAHDLFRAQRAAQIAVLEVSGLVPGGAQQRVEVFVNLSRRMQSLVQRQIQMLDALEAQVEDPELLKGLFTVDHLATRMRRLTESLAVLGGSGSRRQWSRPVSMYDLLRSAIAEVEHYSRVKVVPPVEGTADGGAVADIIHLIAELIENAAKFSAPDTQVMLRTGLVTAGLVIEVEDRGLGMDIADQRRTNDVLADPRRVNIGELLQDGRIGLFVVSALASRYGIKVELKTNIFGGTQAVVVLPRGLVDAPPQDATVGAAEPRAIPEPRVTEPRVTADRRGESGPHPLPERHPSGPLPLPDSRTASGPHPLPVERSASGPHLLPLERAGSRPHPLPVERSAREASTARAAAERAAAERAAAERAAADRPVHEWAAADRPGPERAAGGRAADERPDWRAAAAAVAEQVSNGRHAGRGERPPLPQRRVQENLAPQLRAAPVSHDTESDVDHTPDLMAAFRDGVSRSEDEGWSVDGVDKPS